MVDINISANDFTDGDLTEPSALLTRFISWLFSSNTAAIQEFNKSTQDQKETKIADILGEDDSKKNRFIAAINTLQPQQAMNLIGSNIELMDRFARSPSVEKAFGLLCENPNFTAKLREKDRTKFDEMMIRLIGDDPEKMKRFFRKNKELASEVFNTKVDGADNFRANLKAKDPGIVFAINTKENPILKEKQDHYEKHKTRYNNKVDRLQGKLLKKINRVNELLNIKRQLNKIQELLKQTPSPKGKVKEALKKERERLIEESKKLTYKKGIWFGKSAIDRTLEAEQRKIHVMTGGQVVGSNGDLVVFSTEISATEKSLLGISDQTSQHGSLGKYKTGNTIQKRTTKEKERAQATSRKGEDLMRNLKLVSGAQVQVKPTEIAKMTVGGAVNVAKL